MQVGASPGSQYRVRLGLQPDSTWTQCQNAMNGTAAKAIAVVASNDARAWFPTNQKELEKAIQQATVFSGNWPTIMGTTYAV